MQIVLDTVNPNELSFVSYGTARDRTDLEDMLSLQREKNRFKASLIIDKQRPILPETQQKHVVYTTRCS